MRQLSDTYIIKIPGTARGKQRPRLARHGKFARVYTPEQTVNAEAWVKQCCVDQVGAPCIEGALSLRVTINVNIPASWPKKKQADAAAGSLMPTGKPDVDNVVKLIADALNGVLWRDDAQIVVLEVRKLYAVAPATTLEVTVL